METEAIEFKPSKPGLPIILLPLKQREDESDKSLFKNQSFSSSADMQRPTAQIMQAATHSGLPQVDQIRKFLKKGDQLNTSTFKKLKEDKQIRQLAKQDRSSTSLYRSNRVLQFPMNEEVKQAEIKRLYLSHKKQASKLNFRTALYKFHKTSQQVQTEDPFISETQLEPQPDTTFRHLHKPSYQTIDVPQQDAPNIKAKIIAQPSSIQADQQQNALLPLKQKKGAGVRPKVLSTRTNNAGNFNSYLNTMAKLDFSFHSNLSKYSQRYKEYGQQETVFSKTIDVKPLRPLKQTLSNFGQGKSQFKSMPTTAILDKNQSRTTQQMPAGINLKPVTNIFPLKSDQKARNLNQDSEVFDRNKITSAIQQISNEKDSSMLPQYSQQAYSRSKSRNGEDQVGGSRMGSRATALSAFYSVEPKGTVNKPVTSKMNEKQKEIIKGNLEQKSELIQVPSLHEIKVGQVQSVHKAVHPIKQTFGAKEVDWIHKFYHPKSSFFTTLGSSNFQIKKYQNGVYFGQLSPQGKKHGKGTIFYFSGKIYEGDMLNDLKHGLGNQIHPDGSSYKGQFKEGVRHGRGVFEWSNGQIYDGQWEFGKKTGSGMWTSPEGESYIGQWKKDRVEGFGVFAMKNGSRYEGQFKNSLKHGTGTQRFGNGETFVGSYQRNRPNGEGQYYWANGDYYKGVFSNGLRHGQGFFKEGKTGVQYRGQYHNDKKCGYGEIDYGKGLIYRGNFQNNFRHGYGELFENETIKYRGYWVNDNQIDEQSHSPLTNETPTAEQIGVIQEELERQQTLPKAIPKIISKATQRKIEPLQPLQHQPRGRRLQQKSKDSKPASLSPAEEGECYKRSCGCNRRH